MLLLFFLGGTEENVSGGITDWHPLN
jgi:hypothetical protein